MKPFALKFAKPQKAKNDQELSSMSYDTAQEAMVVRQTCESTLAIDVPRILMITGSHDTLQANDPTRDEPTDR